MSQEFDINPVFDFESVFEVDDYMYFYGDMLTEESTESQVAFLVRELELTRSMKILDLACGFGRHANRLAALGVEVVGIDLTPGFLELARQDAVRRAVHVDYRQGDMRSLDFREEFDRVFLMFTAFGYYEDEENFRILEKITHALKPGGLFAVDLPNRDVFFKSYLPYIVTEKGTDLMIDRITFDTATGKSINRRIVIRDGVRKDKPFFIRLYNPGEITGLLRQAGLQPQRLLGSWESEPLSTESRRMIVIARKPFV
jgi:SAM-dependent methyltransferase